jgi:hypothetical protein
MQTETETRKPKKRRSRWRSLRVDDPMLGALRDVVDWAIDLAQKLVRESDDEVDALDDVRARFHDWLDGAETEVDVFDLWITLGSILDRIERALDADAIDLFAVIASQLGERGPRFLRFPAHRRERGVIRCFDDLN